MNSITSDTLIELIDVSKDYVIGNKKQEVLRGISLSISKDDFICIVGPSGSGKTTLLEIMATIRKPTRGVITFQNEDITNYDNKQLSQIRQKIGYMSQNLTLEPFLTIWENLKLSNKSLSLDDPQLKELLKHFKFEKYLNRYPSQLSGGEYRKAMLLSALMKNPSVIIADEPTANIDLKFAKSIMNLISSINKEGIPIIYSTHSKELSQYAKKIYKLSKGKLIIEK